MSPAPARKFIEVMGDKNVCVCVCVFKQISETSKFYWGFFAVATEKMFVFADIITLLFCGRKITKRIAKWSMKDGFFGVIINARLLHLSGLLLRLAASVPKSGDIDSVVLNEIDHLA